MEEKTKRRLFMLVSGKVASTNAHATPRKIRGLVGTMQYLLTSQPGTYAIQIQIVQHGVAGPCTGASAVEGRQPRQAVWGGVALDNHSDAFRNGSELIDCQKKKQRFRL